MGHDRSHDRADAATTRRGSIKMIVEYVRYRVADGQGAALIDAYKQAAAPMESVSQQWRLSGSLQERAACLYQCLYEGLGAVGKAVHDGNPDL